jgi:hypothetical protein
MVRLEDMVVGRVYRVCAKRLSYLTATDGWLWIWEGEDDGDVNNLWPILKSITTGCEEHFSPEELEAADAEEG